MRIKQGVRIHGMKPETLIGMMITDSVYKSFGKELVVTSGTEGSHSERSKHYAGLAFDCRIRYFDDKTKKHVEQALVRELGDDFIVLNESTHFHIQWSPKKP